MLISAGLINFKNNPLWSRTSMEANPLSEGVIDTLLSDSMFVTNELKIIIIKKRTESCKKKIIMNFLLFKVFLNSHLVMLVNFMVTLKILFGHLTVFMNTSSSVGSLVLIEFTLLPKSSTISDISFLYFKDIKYSPSTKSTAATDGNFIICSL